MSNTLLQNNSEQRAIASQGRATEGCRHAVAAALPFGKAKVTEFHGGGGRGRRSRRCERCCSAACVQHDVSGLYVSVHYAEGVGVGDGADLGGCNVLKGEEEHGWV